MWTSGDCFFCDVLLVTKIPPLPSLTHTHTHFLSPLLLFLCIVQQPLRAVCCFSSLSTCINLETICHQHSGSVGVNKRQEPAGETHMTRQCLSNCGEQVILVILSVSLCIVFIRVVHIYVSVQSHKFVHLWDYCKGWKNQAALFHLQHHH